MAGLDKIDVARAAAGRWREILLSVCSGLPVSALNGTHEKACPKCGGNTRFRAFDDFDERGGVMCSHCHSDRNADGFAAVQWWHNCDFLTAMKMVAEFLKFAPSHLAGSPAAASSARPAALPPQQQDWSTKWKQWQIESGQRLDLLNQWCRARPPIVPQSLLSSCVMFGHWPVTQRDQAVLGFYGYGADESVPNSLLLYRADGSQFGALGKLRERKTHLVGGSKAGWIHVGGIERTRAAEVVWRVEGLPDGLALLPLLPLNHAVVSPSCGAGWNNKSADRNPPLGIFAGKVAIVVGDADAPGQRGAWRFAADVVAVAVRVFYSALPFPVVEVHGLDLRDWIQQGADFAAVQASLSDYAVMMRQMNSVFSLTDDAVVIEPLVNYSRFGKSLIARPIRDVQEQLWDMTDRWPRRVSGRLFVHHRDEISWLNNPSSLCAWFGNRTGTTVDFARDGGVFSKAELFEALLQTSTEYRAVERAPHEPQISGHYYACGEFPSGDGEHLQIEQRHTIFI